MAKKYFKKSVYKKEHVPTEATFVVQRRQRKLKIEKKPIPPLQNLMSLTLLRSTTDKGKINKHNGAMKIYKLKSFAKLSL